MRSTRAFDPVLGLPLDWACTEGAESPTALVLGFGGADRLRLAGAHDGVSLMCVPLDGALPSEGPCPPALTACIGRALLAAEPSVHEYESVHDGVFESGVVLEFEGGRRVCVQHSCGELRIDRTGRSHGERALRPSRVDALGDNASESGNQRAG